jgi:hypothetical protein
VTGLDMTPHLLEEARARAASEGLNIRFDDRQPGPRRRKRQPGAKVRRTGHTAVDISCSYLPVDVAKWR